MAAILSATLMVGLMPALTTAGTPAPDCNVLLAASDGVRSVDDAIVLPRERIHVTGVGWDPVNVLELTITQLSTGNSERNLFLADDKGAIIYDTALGSEASGIYRFRVTQPVPACSAEAFLYVAPAADALLNKFREHIKWMYAEGHTAGCDPHNYCPDGSVTRGQLASFLSRVLDLPATTTDYFTDDETNKHEASINRLREARITFGCTATTFCPNGLVTRGQMASFLVRAFDLPATGTDYFTDDETNKHEANINRLRAASVTFGCTVTTFCPDGLVTRGQMAAFLHRAMGD